MVILANKSKVSIAPSNESSVKITNALVGVYEWSVKKIKIILLN